MIGYWRPSVSWGDGVMTKPELISAEMGTRVTAHALHVGDRINTIGFEGEALSAVPLCANAQAAKSAAHSPTFTIIRLPFPDKRDRCSRRYQP